MVKAADVLNVYVMAPSRDKMWTVLGPEIGDNACKPAILVISCTIYAVVRCKSCDADPDLWIKPEFRPEDKLNYYSYIFCYVDNILCIHYDSDNVLNKLNGYMPLKPTSVRSPNMFLGTKPK